MTFDKINRRTHLYLGLFLLPWLAMYGMSSFIVIHQSMFQGQKSPARQVLFERPYSRPIPSDARNNEPDFRAAAQEILKDCDLEGAFWVDKPNPDTVHIDRFTFRDSTRLIYSIKNQTLKAERELMPWPQVIVRLHFRGGYGQPTVGDKLWGLLVDIACAGIVIWVISGLIMWWRLPRVRGWGALALGSGVASFLVLVWIL